MTLWVTLLKNLCTIQAFFSFFPRCNKQLFASFTQPQNKLLGINVVTLKK